MKLLSSTFILLSLISCGKNGLVDDLYDNLNPTDWDENIKPEIDTEFKSYVKSFEVEYNTKVGYAVVFGNIDRGLAGVCYKYSDGRRLVKISKDVWGGYNDDQRDQLIYHELGHCSLNKRHDTTQENTVSKDYKCPTSIMYPSIFSKFIAENCYTPYKQEYYDRLR